MRQFQDTEGDLPRLIAQHMEDERVLKARLRKSQEAERITGELHHRLFIYEMYTRIMVFRCSVFGVADYYHVTIKKSICKKIILSLDWVPMASFLGLFLIIDPAI